MLARLWHCIQPLYGLKLRSMLLELTSGAVRFNRGVDLIPSNSKGIKYAIGELYPDWNKRTEGFTECLLNLFRIQFSLDVLRLLSNEVCTFRRKYSVYRISIFFSQLYFYSVCSLYKVQIKLKKILKIQNRFYQGWYKIILCEPQN